MIATTRFVTWPRWAARFVFAIVAVVVVAAGAIQPPIPREATPLGISDVKLYRAIAGDVAAGHSYYDAAASEQRAYGYPTAPGQVFREPTLALLLATMRSDFIRMAVLLTLMGITVLCLQRTLAREGLSLSWRLAAIGAAMTSLSVAGTIDGAYVHEIWAALLMALSVILYRPDHWGRSVALGIAACIFRELAFPFLLAMGASAAFERRKFEAIGWVLSAALFLGGYAIHLHFAGLHHRPGDLTSPGWVYLGGLGFVIATARWNLFLHYCPNAIVAAAACLGFLGLAGSRDPRAARSALIVGGYMLAFTVIGRPDNYLWGILYAPFLAIGLLLAPAAIRDLFNRAFGSNTQRRRPPI